MKNKLYKVIPLFMVVVILLGFTACGGSKGSDSIVADTESIETEAIETEISVENVGDIIEFGSYPQSEVKDETLIIKLNELSKNWISYGYYFGIGGDKYGRLESSDYMKYADVTYNGEKYRAVTFSKYRPYHTEYESSEKNSYQDDNGFLVDEIYWFKFEPIKWRVIDPDSGLVLCESVVDSQVFDNKKHYYNDGNYYQDDKYSMYANKYSESTLRTWLNEDFYNLAFDSNQKTKIVNEEGDERQGDNVFLLSYDDVVNGAFGFSSNESKPDDFRKATGTDYAKCQGTYSFKDNSGNERTYWWLLTQGYKSSEVCFVVDNGSISNTCSVYNNTGVRPAIRLNLEA